MEADDRFARVAQDPRFKASLEISCVVWLSLSPVLHVIVKTLMYIFSTFLMVILFSSCASRSIVELAFSLKSNNDCYIDLLLFPENLAKREET